MFKCWKLTFVHALIVIQCLSVDQLYKGQLGELPAILDSGQLCGGFQLGRCLSSHTTVIWRAPEHSNMSDRPKKQAPGKADQATIGNDTHMDC